MESSPCGQNIGRNTLEQVCRASVLEDFIADQAAAQDPGPPHLELKITDNLEQLLHGSVRLDQQRPIADGFAKNELPTARQKEPVFLNSYSYQLLVLEVIIVERVPTDNSEPSG